MNAIRLTLLAAAISIAAAGGCTLHYRPMVACPTAPGELACWESARFDAQGRIEHHIVERARPGDACDALTIEQVSFSDGNVVQRVRDERSCGVIVRRITDRYDLAGNRLQRSIEEDRDRDDRFDDVRTTEVALSAPQRVFAMTAGAQRLVRSRSMIVRAR